MATESTFDIEMAAMIVLQCHAHGSLRLSYLLLAQENISAPRLELKSLAACHLFVMLSFFEPLLVSAAGLSLHRAPIRDSGFSAHAHQKSEY
jgi:hypothetical protein